MRILLCDDDGPLRLVMRGIAVDRNHEVVGEAEATDDAYEMLEALHPDVVVVDIALRSGSGLDVGRAAAAQGCRVIVFSAFLGATTDTDFADAAISKPDFFALEAAIDAVATRQSEGTRWRDGAPERRSTGGAAARPRPLEPVETPDHFYQALGSAQPGDTMMVINVAGGEDAAKVLCVAVRGVLRTHDHLMRRGAEIAVLLVDGTAKAATAVASRLAKVTEGSPDRHDWTWKHLVLTADELPSDGYQRLRKS